MVENKSIKELLEEMAAIADKGQEEEVKSALLYCLKQLKISAAANNQN